jgi:hypothetical protein
MEVPPIILQFGTKCKPSIGNRYNGVNQKRGHYPATGLPFGSDSLFVISILPKRPSAPTPQNNIQENRGYPDNKTMDWLQKPSPLRCRAIILKFN